MSSSRPERLSAHQSMRKMVLRTAVARIVFGLVVAISGVSISSHHAVAQGPGEAEAAAAAAAAAAAQAASQQQGGGPPRGFGGGPAGGPGDQSGQMMGGLEGPSLGGPSMGGLSPGGMGGGTMGGQAMGGGAGPSLGGEGGMDLFGNNGQSPPAAAPLGPSPMALWEMLGIRWTPLQQKFAEVMTNGQSPDAPPVDVGPVLRNEATVAYRYGNLPLALELYFGHLARGDAAAQADLKQILFSPYLRKPTWHLRWGVSLALRGDTDVTSFGAISAGGRTGGMGGMGGGFGGPGMGGGELGMGGGFGGPGMGVEGAGRGRGGEDQGGASPGGGRPRGGSLTGGFGGPGGGIGGAPGGAAGIEGGGGGRPGAPGGLGDLFGGPRGGGMGPGGMGPGGMSPGGIRPGGIGPGGIGPGGIGPGGMSPGGPGGMSASTGVIVPDAQMLDPDVDARLNDVLGLVAQRVGDEMRQRYEDGKFGRALTNVSATSSSSEGYTVGGETVDSSPQSMWIPGFVFLGEGNSTEIVKTARRKKIDFLLHFDVNIREGREGEVRNNSRVRVVDCNTGKTIVASGAFDTDEADRLSQGDRGTPDAYVDEQLTTLLAVVDDRLELKPLPKLSTDAAKRRITQIMSDPSMSPLRQMAEIRWFASEKLIEEADLESAFEISGGIDALQILYGTDRQAQDVVRRLARAAVNEDAEG